MDYTTLGIGIGIGFVVGYLVRALISWRRRRKYRRL